MTPRAVLAGPVAPVAPWRGLVVTAHAEVLLMAGETAVTVPLSHIAVAERSPGVRVVTGHLYIMTGDAVGPLMADEAGIPRVRPIDVR